jgi:hypothetical protein
MDISWWAACRIRRLRGRGARPAVRVGLREGRPFIRWALMRGPRDHVYFQGGIMVVIDNDSDRLLHGYRLIVRERPEGPRFVLLQS